MYARRLHVLHSQFSDAPCAHTAREATMPCAYNNSTSYTLNSLTHHASKQQERLQSLVLTTQRLPLSILQHTLRPHSEKGHKALYLQQPTSYTLNSLTHHASTQRARLQSLALTTPRLPLSILQRTLRPHSEKGHKALYLQQLHVFCSQFSDATLHPHSEKGNPALCLRQWDKQPSPASVAGKATQPYGNLTNIATLSAL